MPITFEQPGPYDPAVSEAYGRLQQQLANRQAGGGGGGSGGGGFGPGGHFGNSLEGGGGGNTFSGGADFQGAVEARLAVNQGALSQAEDMERQRLQQGLSENDQQLNDREIDEAQHADNAEMIKSRLTPMQYRMAQNQTQIQEQQIRALQNSNATQEATLHANAVFRARGVNETLTTAFNPEVMAQVKQEMDPQDFASPEEFQRELEAEATRRGGSVQMIETAPGIRQPIQFPGSQQGGGTGGARGSRGTSVQEPNIPQLETRALALVRAAHPELTGQPFLDKVQEQVDRMTQQHNDRNAAQQPPPRPQAPWQVNRDIRVGRQSILSHIANLGQQNPDSDQQTFELREAIGAARPDWDRVAAALDAMPREMANAIPSTPALNAKIQEARNRRRPAQQAQAAGPAGPAQVLPMAPQQAPNAPGAEVMGGVGGGSSSALGGQAPEGRMQAVPESPADRATRLAQEQAWYARHAQQSQAQEREQAARATAEQTRHMTPAQRERYIDAYLSVNRRR